MTQDQLNLNYMSASQDRNLLPDNSFNLIDLAPLSSITEPLGSSKRDSEGYTSKSFMEDLAGLQPTIVDPPKPLAAVKKSPPGQYSTLPLLNKTSKRLGRRTRSRFDESVQNRPSTPESIASEIRRAQAMVDHIPVDPYTQWYQVMQNYYKQFYPGYSYGTPHTQQLPRHVPKSVVPLVQPPAQSAAQPSQHQTSPFNFPRYPPWPAISQQRGQQNFHPMPDYAAYYYQYYLGAMAAANGWPVPIGRTTPKIYNEPHIRASISTPGILIQVLPNRPQEAEPGRIELLDLSQLASEVVAEVTSRLAQVTISVRKIHNNGAILANSYQGSSEGPASLLPDNEEFDVDEVEEEEEVYMGLLNAWDRTDHVLYPGPLCQGTTLKHDVQAFLRGKMEDIQDRMPIDWDSAGLFLAYLELLVKNNGIAHAGDVVSLLLGNESFKTYDYPPNTITSSVSPFPFGRTSTLPAVNRTSSFHYSTESAGIINEASGRESPHVLAHASSTGGFLNLQHQQNQHQNQRSSAASSTGGVSVSRLLRRGLLADFGGVPEREEAVLQRFRELLMHGHPLKALDLACQQQLWGHAFALGHRLGSVSLERVMEKFLARAVHPSDPLLTFYQLTAGEIPRSVDQLAYAVGADAGDWRPHLAMILSAAEGHEDLVREALERMGESLLARRLHFAAQLCFLIASSSAVSPSVHMPSQICLLGVPETKSEEGTLAEGRHFVMTAAVERASTEAVQLTEVYEYALALATRDHNFFLPHFLPFKFAYCLRLIDAGLIEKAFRYLEVLSVSFSTLLEQEMKESSLQQIDLRSIFLMASQCLRLAEQLRYHPEVGSFESSAVNANFRGGGISWRPQDCSRWLERLRSVYQRMCSMLGLPNADRPYTNLLQAREHKLSHMQDQQPNMQTSVERNDPQPPPYGNKQSYSPAIQQRPSQSPQIHQQQQQHQQEHHPIQSTVPPSQTDSVKLSSVPKSTPPPLLSQSVVPDMTSSQGPPPSHSEMLPKHDNLIQQPLHSPHYRKQEPVVSHSATPPSMSSSPSAEQPVIAQGFFVPSVDLSASEAPSRAGDPSGYDYFAGIGYSQPISRSRTVSGASSQESSTMASSRSPSTPVSQGPRTRQVSNSGPLLCDHRSRTTNRASPVKPSSDGAEAKHDHPAFTTAPPQPPNAKSVPPDNYPRASEKPQQPKTLPEENKSVPSSGKSGWFSGLLGRVKGGGQEIHLPDDSNPSIVWDEVGGCWRDLHDGDSANATPPPPPPPPQPTMSTAAPSTSRQVGGVPPLLPPVHCPSVGGTPSSRARYVNVLANSSVNGGGTSKSTILTPPLPTP